jgi:hypothetical protein
LAGRGSIRQSSRSRAFLLRPFPSLTRRLEPSGDV